MNILSHNLNLLFIILLLGNTGRITFAQWISTGGPCGGQINALLKDSDKIYAGGLGGGVFVSDNDGTSWYQSSNGLTHGYINTIAKNNNRIFAGTYYGIYVSSDFGSNWNESGLTDEIVMSIAPSGNNIYAGTFGHGVYLSTDDGNHWESRSNGLANQVIASIVEDSIYLYAGVTGDGVYRSSNSGMNWEQINSGLTNLYVHSLVIRENKIIAGTENGIFISTDKGNIWYSSDSSLTGLYISVLTNFNNRILAGSLAGGIYISQDEGNSWELANDGAKYPYLSAIIVNSEDIITGSQFGICISTDTGINWILSNNGLNNSASYSTISRSNRIFSATSNGGFQTESTNFNWSQMGNGLPEFTGVEKLFTYGGSLFAICWGEIYLSNDDGYSWIMIYPPNYPPANSVYVTNEIIYVGSAAGVYYSEDGGTIWKLQDNGIPKNVSIFTFGGRLNRVFAGSRDGVYISTNGGLSWIADSSSMIGSVITFAFYDTLVFAGTTMVYGKSPGVYVTEDYGHSWAKITDGLTNFFSIQKINVFNDMIFAGTVASTDLGGGIYKANVGEYSWIKINDGLRNIVINDIAFSNDRIFVSTLGNGVWYREISDLTDVNFGNSQRENGFILEQNYPNPFNPTTTISYHISQPGLVNLKIYDMLGREVTVLVDAEKPAGRYSIEFDGSKLASGIYIYQLRVNDYLTSKKMLLLK